MPDSLVNDATSYQYLAESIRKHPDQEQLKTLMMEQGFERAFKLFKIAGDAADLVVLFADPIQGEIDNDLRLRATFGNPLHSIRNVA